MKIIWLDECASTNSYAASLEGDGTPVVVATRSQTAGRGQKGNTWEAEPGMNLTFSAVWRPVDFPARCQFAISEAVALAVVDWLLTVGIRATVKWPNDIYVGDRKICGILIEHSVTGMNIDRTIAGVGINVNQRRFFSDAPNPVSCFQLTGREEELESSLESFVSFLVKRLDSVAVPGAATSVHREFCESAWRFDGAWHPFRDVRSGRCYSGRIAGIAPDGFLEVEESSDGIHKYAFKEVEFLPDEGI